jgi:hypothetical protein
VKFNDGEQFVYARSHKSCMKAPDPSGIHRRRSPIATRGRYGYRFTIPWGGGFRLLSVLNDGSNGGSDLLAKWWTANSKVRRGLRPRTYTKGTTRGRCTEAEISGERQHEASAVRAKMPAWLLGKGVARLTSGAHEAAVDAHTGTGSWAHSVGANARAGRRARVVNLGAGPATWDLGPLPFFLFFILFSFLFQI